VSPDPLRLALIGCGVIGERHIIALEELEQRGLHEVVVTAVCDTVEENARRLAQRIESELGGRPAVYTDYRNLLERERIDAVDICLPHGLHHGTAVDCLEAGAHVLCEKPLGITIAASRQMAEAADRTGKVLATAVPYRRLPGQRTARWILNGSGLIGRPLTFFHHAARPSSEPGAGQPVPPLWVWRRNRQMSGGGMVMDSGFHYCDSMRYFFGEVERVYAEVRAVGDGEPRSLAEAREDTAFVTLSFKSGVVGSWCWSLAIAGERTRSIVFYGSEGSLRDTTESDASIFHLFWRNPPQVMERGVVTTRDGSTLTLEELEARYLESLDEAEREQLFPRGCTDGFAIEIYDFVEAVRGRRPRPEVDGWDGLRTLAVCEAAYESAFSGEPVLVDDVIAGRRRDYQHMVDEHWGL